MLYPTKPGGEEWYLADDASRCGGSVDAMPITWGGPITSYRWDSATDVDFKWLSVREMVPPAP